MLKVQSLYIKLLHLKSLTKPSELGLLIKRIFDMKLLFATFAVILISFSATADKIWTTHSKKNEMDGKMSFYAFTDKSVKPNSPMSFPYNKVASFISLACSHENKAISLSFLFNVSPNIINKEIIATNFDNIKTRIKFDEKITNVELLQKWGGKGMTLRNNKQYLNVLKNSDELLLELNWHGNGKRYFKHAITGFSKVYEELKSKCGA